MKKIILIAILSMFSTSYLNAQKLEKMNLKAKKITGTEAEVSWKANKKYRGYHVQIKSEGKDWENKILSTSDKYTLINLMSNTKYSLRIAAYSNLNNGIESYSETITFSTDRVDFNKLMNKEIDNSFHFKTKIPTDNPQTVFLDWTKHSTCNFYTIFSSYDGKTWIKNQGTTDNHTALMNLQANSKVFIRIGLSKSENAEIEAYSETMTVQTLKNPEIKKTDNKKIKK